MGDRREVLLGRFRAGSVDRIRRVTLALIEFEQGRGHEEQGKEVARELHTLKGEARMLGLTKISEVAHAAEEVFLAGRESGALTMQTCTILIAGLAVVARWLRGELGDELKGDAILAEAREQLMAAAAPSAKTSPPPASATTQATEETRAEAEHPARGMGGASKRQDERWVQMSTRRVDDLCERLAEHAMEFQSNHAQLRTLLQTGEKIDTLGGRLLLEDFDRARSRLDELTSLAWSLRLVPVEPVFGELVRHARELALGQGKRLRVQVMGDGAQVERSVLDTLVEPLLHVVRNAVDHGIERPDERGKKDPEACLTIHAEPIGANVVLSIADDGRGIDTVVVRNLAVARGLVTRQVVDSLPARDVLELLFQHGFSTRAFVNEISGRGVGLDVVRDAAESIGGSVVLTSELGRGTRVALTIPATISKERALVVDCAGALYGVPSRHIVEVVRLSDRMVETVTGGRVLRSGQDTMPLKSISATLGTGAASEDDFVLVLESGSRHHAFSVPEIVGEFDLVRRPADALLAQSGFIGASATLDDGRLVLVLAIAGLIRRREGEVKTLGKAVTVKRRRILVVDDSAIVRDLIAELLSSAGFEVRVASDGLSALASLDAGQPDAVLSDIEMPGMDGFELLRRIRARSQRLPVVMLSTRASADDRRQATVLGADAYLVKSDFQQTALLETIKRLVGSGGLQN